MSIIATVVGGVVLSIMKIVDNRLSPNAKYLIWLVFLVTLVLPIAIPSRISIYNVVDISDVKEVRDTESEDILDLWEKEKSSNVIEENLKEEIARNNTKIGKNYLKRIIPLAWLIVFVILLTKRIVSYFMMNKLVEGDEVENQRANLILEDCKKSLKIRKNIKLVRQDMTEMPSTVGVFYVKILVTDSFLNLDDDSITNVFMHELSHYKRKDNMVNFMILIIKSLHWFNPFMEKMFKNIREEMEFATDEIAVSKMNIEERMGYCKCMAEFSINSNTYSEQILGLSNTAETVSKRIKRISLKKEYDKKSKIIFSITIWIIILMSLILYPTSYGMFETPRLYLQLENGDRIEATKVEENMILNEINLSKDEKIKLVVKSGKPKDYIFYNKADLETINSSKEMVNLSDGKMKYFETEEAIYKFTVTYGKNKNVDYAIKIVVE